MIWHTVLGRKPLDLDLADPLPARIRVYAYTLTDPPGGRPAGEFKIQVIAPGQRKGERASFDRSGGRFVVLAGYNPETGVFVLWDAFLYPDFPHSRNVQVAGETVFAALAGGVARQSRILRTGEETVLAAKGSELAAAIRQRFMLTVMRETALP
ncbi:MAG TPA: hypothetical protein VK399_05600 [Longimicrobiaceae bacterium]|nr:hypothetical protein [Longimicrobiaceae bacterium]